ncbi:hypothetical protein [Bosea sp. BK604]|uniref:hypothetical protein n=1 Tax=Bosea sp. BK604 TaxID=2512180 RepID=UPI0014055531|nr:hypothetical protein [Bosea sp. BK604]
MVVMPPAGERSPWFRLGFWCVPAMSHLVGLTSTVLRPDALYAACMKAGGSICEWDDEPLGV